ncbi:fimbrial protein [Providencia manganoxydans]|uniref:fimbrial protein n=1 Tax=Providencia manganoxydans TaxID=2923283 RepID=UPI00292905D0|nr:fimbrial protein [Providencia rettgeri]
MKFNKKLMVAVIPVALVLSNNSFADDKPVPVSPTPITVKGGIINFTGSIVNTPCVVDNDDASQTVKLGQFRQDAFSGKDSTSSPVGFDIKLTGCAIDTFKKAAVTFSGITVPNSTDKLALTASQAGQSTASGVGIQILQNSEVVKVDGSTPTSSVLLSKGDSTLRFQAQYIALDNQVTAGEANASADFTITYQ